MNTWTWIEVVWTVANMLGVLGNGRLIWLTWRKAQAAIRLGAVRGGPRLLAANRYVRNDAGRLVCHLIGSAIGIYAMLVDASDPLLDVLSAWGLVGIIAVLAALSIFDLLDERRLDRLLARQQELGVDRGGSGGHLR